MLRAVLEGVAVADAVGNRLEFGYPTDADFEKEWNSPVLRVTDDTQMSLFLAEALFLREASHLATDPTIDLKMIRGYLRWYETQRKSGPSKNAQGLLKFPELYAMEAPGSTCMTSMNSWFCNVPPAQNDSKGNGTVMRCAPIAVLAEVESLSAEEAFTLAEMDANITHHHAYAAQSSAMAVFLYRCLLNGYSMLEAVGCLPGNNYPCKLVLSMQEDGPYNELKNRKRSGWVAEEALALAVGAVLRDGDYKDIVKRAIVFAGDSDTVGAIAGGLAAAAGILPPTAQVERLNVKSALDWLTDRADKKRILH